MNEGVDDVPGAQVGPPENRRTSSDFIFKSLVLCPSIPQLPPDTVPGRRNHSLGVRGRQGNGGVLQYTFNNGHYGGAETQTRCETGPQDGVCQRYSCLRRLGQGGGVVFRGMWIVAPARKIFSRYISLTCIFVFICIYIGRYMGVKRMNENDLKRPSTTLRFLFRSALSVARS